MYKARYRKKKKRHFRCLERLELQKNKRERERRRRERGVGGAKRKKR